LPDEPIMFLYDDGSDYIIPDIYKNQLKEGKHYVYKDWYSFRENETFSTLQYTKSGVIKICKLINSRQSIYVAKWAMSLQLEPLRQIHRQHRDGITKHYITPDNFVLLMDLEIDTERTIYDSLRELRPENRNALRKYLIKGIAN